MRNMIVALNPESPIVNRNSGLAHDTFRLFLWQTHQRGLLIGSGSPEGVLSAEQGVEYMDEDGAPGYVKWIKQKAQIAGDSRAGWVRICQCS